MIFLTKSRSEGLQSRKQKKPGQKVVGAARTEDKERVPLRTCKKDPPKYGPVTHKSERKGGGKEFHRGRGRWGKARRSGLKLVIGTAPGETENIYSSNSRRSATREDKVVKIFTKRGEALTWGGL